MINYKPPQRVKVLHNWSSGEREAIADQIQQKLQLLGNLQGLLRSASPETLDAIRETGFAEFVEAGK